MTRVRVGTVLLAAALLLASCSGGSKRVIARSAGDPLAAEVEAIRQSATAGDRNAVVSQLAQLTADTARFRDSGQVSDAAAASILSAARAVASKLDGLPTTTTTTATSTTTTTTTTTAPPKKGKGNDRGDGGD